MRYFENIESCANTCVAFGRFEGMHKGHLAVVKALSKVGQEKGLESVMLSFFMPQKPVLTTEKEKAYFAEKAGVNTVISCQMTSEIESLTAEKFVEDVLIQKLGAKTIIVGENLNFNGFDYQAIKNEAQSNGIEVITCETARYDGEVISTELIEKAFDSSDFEKYNALCGHPYIMIGVVEHGKALGRTVGMPTANLGVDETKKIPKSGVCATISVIDNERFMGLTNIGKRPSVDNEDRITIETHILDFSKDIYGKQNILEVHFHIRGVVKFNNLQEVQNQVQKDISCSREKLQVLFH